MNHYHRSALIIIVFLSAAIKELRAENVLISNLNMTGNPNAVKPSMKILFTISWDDAWNNEINHDAAWVFFKVRIGFDESRSERHIYLSDKFRFIHSYIAGAPLPVSVRSGNGAGILIFPSKKYKGAVSWRCEIEIDAEKTSERVNLTELLFCKGYAIEMVQVPAGPYYLGDSDTTAQNNASFFDYSTKSFRKIGNEDSIVVAEKAGGIYYRNNNQPQYRGDSKGTVPSKFPKGTREFYAMKYELRQGDYTSFLNSLGYSPSNNRAISGGKNVASERTGISKPEDGIYLTGEKYFTGKPQRPLNFSSWDDGCAFADWAGLRPMTEMEYEKACRGSQKPLPGSYPWGTADRSLLSRYFNDEGDLVWEKGLNEADMNDGNKELSGFSFYWIRDLAGGVWERVVTIGNEKGRSFNGTHGDGTLDEFGNATNSDWPNEHDGGFGYRGSAYYKIGMRGDPQHPVSYRPYGAWGDGPRTVAYGFRGVISLN